MNDSEKYDDIDIRVEDPVTFPLGTPDDDVIKALQKAWARQDLNTYVEKRWTGAYVPPFPDTFWEYDWRACDIGSGFGRFGWVESQKHPTRAYLSIDKGKRRGGGMLRRYEEKDVPNVLPLHGNAIPILANMPHASLNLITLFYPNPWWPKKHQKKRWSYHPLLPHLFDLLVPGGCLMLCANERFYLQEWLWTLQHHPAAHCMKEEYVGPIQVSEGRSDFEVKFIHHNVSCGEIRFRKE